MKKFTLFCSIMIAAFSLQVSAQYDNSTLNGPWFIELPPASPYSDSLLYVVFDGAGNVITFSGFCSSNIGGTYSVSTSGAITCTLICDADNYPLTGQLTSSTTGTMELDQTYNLIKVSNPGALATTLTGTLYTESCGENNVVITLDGDGIITAATGLIAPVTGRVYTEGGMFMGHLRSGGTNGWNEFSIMGYYASNVLTGQVGLDNNGCGITTANLTRSGAVSINEIASNTIAIYPNPASDIVTINFSNISDENSMITIYNTMGEVVWSELALQNQQQINVATLSNGIYFLEIKSDDFSGKQKLVIQK